MGAVYEVVDVRTESPRALKVMLPSIVEDPDLRARFALEARVTGNIISDHVVRVLDAGIDEASGTPFLVMDLLQGEEVGGLAHRRGALPFDEVVLYLRQAALALDKTHAAGIVHRDLKPENLFVTYRDDGSPCVKILDFGIAKVVAQSTARATRAVGTPLYMSPEQIRGDGRVSARADVYALGHIAYTLLVGEPYWAPEMKAAESVYPLLTAIMTGLPEAATARALRRRRIMLPPAFDGWFATCVALHAEQRPERATLALSALAEALGIGAARPGMASMSSIETARVAGPPVAALPVAGSPVAWPTVVAPPPTALSPAGALQPPTFSDAATIRSGSTSVAVMSEAARRAPMRPVLAAAAALGALALLGTAGILTLRARTGHAGPASASPAVVASETAPPAVEVAPVATVVPTVAPELTPSAGPTASASAAPPPSSKPASKRPASIPTTKPTTRGIF
jgi:serine/threonine-protein kinase